jgi:hypothetical protein
LQARKVKAASPLGLLFDHGLDIWVIPFFNIMNLCTTLNYGDSGFVAIFVMQSFTCIYHLNVEQLFVGVLDLPTLDANADGVHLIVGTMILRIFVGRDFWRSPVIWGFSQNETTLILPLIWAVSVLARK